MGYILTSDDHTQGHSNLTVRNMIDLRYMLTNILEMSGSYQTGQNVPHFKIDKIEFQMPVVTLRMGSRSNMWYVQKGLVMGDILTP